MKIQFILLCVFFNSVKSFKIYFEHEDIYEDVDGNEISRSSEKTFQLIVPGTKWCGSGNIAANDSDLGKAEETDYCCREHDMCDDIIEAGESKYNLTNDAYYTRLHCKCDERFYDCLKSGGIKLSNAVGTIYFNVLGTKCYREDFPIVRCVKYHNILRTRCVEYLQNLNAPIVWQWFDVPPY